MVTMPAAGEGRVRYGRHYHEDMVFVPPPADPTKLLAAWMDWEKGETPPGRTLANLKTGGMRELLEGLLAGAGAASTEGASPTQ